MKTLTILLLFTIAAHAGSFKAPRRGMTESQVRAIYGNPTQVSEVDGQLQWIYISGLGRMFNPFTMLRGPDVLSVTFNGNHRVQGYKIEN